MDGRSFVLPGGRTGIVGVGVLHPGIYAIRAEGAGGVFVQKFLVDQ
jgi:hypothetical protein